MSVVTIPGDLVSRSVCVSLSIRVVVWLVILVGFVMDWEEVTTV